MNRRLTALACLALVLLLGAEAGATSRYALVVGANAGDARQQVLRYAESDAHRVAEVLRTVGGFPAQNVTVLTDVTAGELRRSLIDLNARLRERTGDTMLLVFYTGHADGAGLQLRGTRLPFQELRGLVSGSPATTRLLVIDACRSGVLTRVKGGKAAPGFAVARAPLPITARGMAILASSSALEDAQESDELRSSFFTHYFLSALRGAADADRDDQVTLSEAYAYTAERTLAATRITRVGPQHPTYRFDLGGRNDLVLSRTASLRGGLGILEFAEPGEYVVSEAGGSGAPVGEVAVPAGAARRIALPRGRYHVVRRGRDHLLEGEFAVAPGTATPVRRRRMTELAYARVVRKGGTAETSALSVYAAGGARGSLLGLGTSWQGTVGGRIDLAELSVELRMTGGWASTTNERLTIDTRELGGSALGLRAFDLGRVTLAAGVEVGATWFAQRFAEPGTPDRDTVGMMLGPIGVSEVPLGRWYLRAEVGALTYILRTGNDAEGTDATTPLALRAGLGIGAYY